MSKIINKKWGTGPPLPEFLSVWGIFGYSQDLVTFFLRTKLIKKH